jgi:hypothetical protein
MKQELKTGQQEIVDTQRVMVENLETTDNPDEIAKPKFRVGENERTEGAALRALYHFLKHVDAHQGLGWSQRNPHPRWQSPLALCRASRNLPG